MPIALTRPTGLLPKARAFRSKFLFETAAHENNSFHRLQLFPRCDNLPLPRSPGSTPKTQGTPKVHTHTAAYPTYQRIDQNRLFLPPSQRGNTFAPFHCPLTSRPDCPPPSENKTLVPRKKYPTQKKACSDATTSAIRRTPSGPTQHQSRDPWLHSSSSQINPNT